MSSFTTIALAFSTALFVILWRKYRRLFFGTPLDNVPGPAPSVGTLEKLYARDGWAFHNLLATKYGRAAKVADPWGGHQIFTYDPKALYHILVKDQNIYEETSTFIQTRLLVFGEGLTATLGDRHKKQRKMLSPAFSISAMRDMCPIFYGVGHKLQSAIQARVKDGAREIDMAGWMSRTALQLIGESGLGYSFDPLTQDSHVNNYAVALKALMPAIFELEIVRNHLPWIVKIGSPKFRRFLIDIIPWKKLHEVRDIVDTVARTSAEILEDKKRAIAEGDVAVQEQVGAGKDVMSILLRANMEASEEDKLPESEIAAQISVLTLAATDTTSSALSRTLMLLAQHPEAQDRLRAELVEARKVNDGHDIPYDQLVGLPYLDAICRETLRLHAPVAFQSRVARQDAVLPLSQPIQGIDGTSMNEILIPKNTVLMVGLLASNRDPDIWGADVLDWKPERWLQPLPQAVSNAKIPGIYSNLMTFLAGSRACIGFKLSQLEMKVVLSLLVESFRFSLSKEKIVWNFSLIAFPSVEGSNPDTNLEEPARMPLVVSAV